MFYIYFFWSFCHLIFQIDITSNTFFRGRRRRRRRLRGG